MGSLGALLASVSRLRGKVVSKACKGEAHRD